MLKFLVKSGSTDKLFTINPDNKIIMQVIILRGNTFFRIWQNNHPYLSHFGLNSTKC